MAVNSPLIAGSVPSHFLPSETYSTHSRDYFDSVFVSQRKSVSAASPYSPASSSSSSSQPILVAQDESNLSKSAQLAPPKRWNTLCHGKVEQVTRSDEGHIVNSWRWPSKKIRDKVVATGFGRAASLCFPLATDDRIGLMCRLCMILVFVDDIIDHPSCTDADAYKQRLLSIMRGTTKPNLDDSAEPLLYNLWIEIRALDPILADQLLDSVVLWFAAMDISSEHACKSLGQYLTYRENDVGREMLSAMVRYAMALHLTPAELLSIKPVEQNFVRQYSLVNDICSYERETRTAESSEIRSTVRILAEETRLNVLAVKRLLWAMVREYDERHELMTTEFELGECSENVKRYMEGVRCMMSGNEEWHLTSPRYNDDVKI